MRQVLLSFPFNGRRRLTPREIGCPAHIQTTSKWVVEPGVRLALRLCERTLPGNHTQLLESGLLIILVHASAQKPDSTTGDLYILQPRLSYCLSSGPELSHPRLVGK